MKIPDNAGQPQARPPNPRPPNPRPAPAGESSAVTSSGRVDPDENIVPTTDSPATDAVDISGLTQQLQPDPARLDRLREALRDGTYSVPSRQVAAKLLDEHLDDPNKHS